MISWLVESDCPAAAEAFELESLALAKMTLNTIKTSGHKQATARAKTIRALLPLPSPMLALLLPLVL